MSDEDWGPWIDFSGGTCPVVGRYVQIVFNDGELEEGHANDHVYWYYVVRYRVRREVEDAAPMRYKERELEPAS